MHTESNSFLVEFSLKVLLESQGWLVGFSNHFLVGKHVHATALAGFHLKVLLVVFCNAFHHSLVCHLHAIPLLSDMFLLMVQSP